MPPLLLFDLDNTLIDRNQAFRGWAQRFLRARALPLEDLGWLSTLDCGGYFPREALLRATVSRYGLHVSLEKLLDDYAETMIELIDCPEEHRAALRKARAAGWTLGIVSNGSTKQQQAKIERTGLDDLVDGWIISEEANCEKPDPLIFQLAADRCRRGTSAGAYRPSDLPGLKDLTDVAGLTEVAGLSGALDDGDWTRTTWMVGDHAPADIAGAAVAGLRSVWLNHGRPWPELDYRPTITATGIPEAVDEVLNAPLFA
ncbi:HAD family hydrolase [Streptacidiphilus anmyonensis]|uniref:HAD family hydrolase n=1 Tax=Streptacidiphilus anmyonensis TaxID=405782 RepID=UPI0005A96B75|nr:HAD family hydrolase [Streptacidiphilus anmyonensis]